MKQFEKVLLSSVLIGSVLFACKVTETEYVDRIVEKEVEVEVEKIVEKEYAKAVVFTANKTDDGISLSMTSETADATIYYTQDESEPSAESTKYNGEFTVTSDTTFKAIAVKSGLENSPISCAVVSITNGTISQSKTYASPVTFTVSENADGVILVSLHTETEDATIYYATGDTSPSEWSKEYSEPFSITKDTTFYAVAKKAGFEDSPISCAFVSFKDKAVTVVTKEVEKKVEVIKYVDKILEKNYAESPIFTPAVNDNGTVRLMITSTTSDATIYYTTNGSIPTTESTKYTEAITLTETTTIKAIAVSDGIENSPISVATISITEKKIELDETAPADVTNVTVLPKDGAVQLSWTDAKDEDIYGYEVAYSAATSTTSGRAAFVPLENNAIIVAPATEHCIISSLTNGTSYTFTIKTVDTNGNKSNGVSVSAIPLNATIVTSDTVANAVKNMTSDGIIMVAGDVTLSTIKTALNSLATTSPNVRVSLDLSKVTNLTEIGNKAFNGCSNLSSVILPDGVTKIGDYAFSECTRLRGTFVIPNTVTELGVSTFLNCTGITRFVIPVSLKTSGDRAFAQCKNLVRVDYLGTITDWLKISFASGNSNPLLMGHHLYIDNKEVTEVTIPEGITSIGKCAFYGCTGLTSVTISNGVTGIENYAFATCTNLASVTISESLTNIGYRAFSWCGEQLTSVTFADTESEWYSTDKSDFTDGIKIGAMTDPNTNATLLKDTYNTKYLYNSKYEQ